MNGVGAQREGTPTSAELAALDAACFPSAECWSASLWQDELDAGDRVVLTERDQDGLVAAATFQVVCEVADLHRVMVRPDARGHRVGERLVREGITACAARGATRMLLEVATDNEPAVRLYRRLGFEVVAGRDNYYGQGRDAWVMQRSLS